MIVNITDFGNCILARAKQRLTKEKKEGKNYTVYRSTNVPDLHNPQQSSCLRRRRQRATTARISSLLASAADARDGDVPVDLAPLATAAAEATKGLLSDAHCVLEAGAAKLPAQTTRHPPKQASTRRGLFVRV